MLLLNLALMHYRYLFLLRSSYNPIFFIGLCKNILTEKTGSISFNILIHKRAPGSPYEAAINRYIRWYNEGGLISAIVRSVHAERYLKNPYIYNVLRQTKPTPGEAERLSITHLTGIFIIWGVGTGAAILAFLLEIAQKFRI